MKTRSFVLFTLIAVSLVAQDKSNPMRNVADPGVVVTRQNITPAGVQSVFEGRVYAVAFGATPAEVWAVSETRLVCLDWRANRVVTSLPIAIKGGRAARARNDDPEVNASIAFTGKPGIQGLAVDAAGRPFLTAAGGGDVRLLTAENNAIRPVASNLGSQVTGTVVLAPRKNAAGQHFAVIPIIAKNVAAIVDVETGKLLASVPTGIAPVGAAINAEGTIAYVSNWAGRVAGPGDRTAPTGLAEDADQVVIDPRGIASTGTLTKIDLRTLRAVATVAVELHPTALAWDEPRHRLYVANGNSDTVSVIDTRTDRARTAIALRPFSVATPGVAPTALAVSADGATLFVACGGINAVAVIETAGGTTKGLIPTAWYPSGLALSADGKHLAVATLLGIGSGSQGEPQKRFVKAYRGTVNVVPVPDAAQLAGYTTAVAENNHVPIKGAAAVAAAATARPPAIAIPRRAGEPSLIEHVVYVIKENRTYDQVFGDMRKGNGDPAFVMFGEAVTPNQHRLADQYVLLDNFYASGGNSGDGHQWITQANETDYAMWPGWAGRSYPFDGTDPVAYASGGFLWDYALRAKKTVQVFGEFAPRVTRGRGDASRAELFTQWRAGQAFEKAWQTKSPIPPLDGLLVRSFPGYSTAIPDVIRARLFNAELKKWEAAGRMPNLVFLQLPSNHTNGTSPGANTPKAMVADNDLALGQVVEALSHSPFWKKMAIFVVEDDAQNGVDHVDGHRTVALAISPFVRRDYVDSTFYAHPSIAKTIELILGLPTMSLFDLIANDMRASFQDQPDFTPYVAVQPAQSLDEMNPPAKALRGQARKAATASARMRFDVPDAAPTEQLNRIVWHQVRGWDVPYPEVKHAAFAPLSVDLEDDER